MTLPKAFAIDQRHLGNLCSKAQLEAESCAGRQPIGKVMTKTPLLDAPLQGPAYAVSGFGKLPRLAFILDGQVRLVPQAESKSVRRAPADHGPDGARRPDRLLPPRPSSAARRAIWSTPGASAKATRWSRSTTHGQNGKDVTQNVTTKTACGGGKG